MICWGSSNDEQKACSHPSDYKFIRRKNIFFFHQFDRKHLQAKVSSLPVFSFFFFNYYHSGQENSIKTNVKVKIPSIFFFV